MVEALAALWVEDELLLEEPQPARASSAIAVSAAARRVRPREIVKRPTRGTVAIPDGARLHG